jgi:hypothetical protein
MFWLDAVTKLIVRPASWLLELVAAVRNIGCVIAKFMV